MTEKKPTIASLNEKLNALINAVHELTVMLGKIQGKLADHVATPDAHNPGTMGRGK